MIVLVFIIAIAAVVWLCSKSATVGAQLASTTYHLGDSLKEQGWETNGVLWWQPLMPDVKESVVYKAPRFACLSLKLRLYIAYNLFKLKIKRLLK